MNTSMPNFINRTAEDALVSPKSTVSISCSSLDNLNSLIGSELIGMSVNSVISMLRALKLPIPEVTRVYVNQRIQNGDYIIGPGDQIEIREFAPEKA